MAARLDDSVAFFDRGGRLLATLTLRPDPLVEGTDGTVWFPDTPKWKDSAACLLGHRAFPVAWCEDALLDDTLIERLITP